MSSPERPTQFSVTVRRGRRLISERRYTTADTSRSANKSPGKPAGLTERLRARFGFTKTQAVVAIALVEGLSYGEIAKKLGVSYHTVHTHMKAIHTKAGVSTAGRLTALMRGALDNS